MSVPDPVSTPGPLAGPRMCQTHWETLRARINEAGLGALVADTGEEVVSRMVSQQQDGLTVDNFEPLIAAYTAIMVNAIKEFGPEGICHKPPPNDQEHHNNLCPICNGNDWHQWGCDDPTCTFTFDEWIGYAVEGQVQVWKGLGT